MDRTGIFSLVAGIVLLLLGAWGVYVFLPFVLDFIKGMIGIAAILIGIFLVIFGVLMIRE